MQKIRYVSIAILSIIISGCYSTFLSNKEKQEILDDLFIRIYENSLTNMNCETIQIYKYFSNSDSNSYIDTSSIHRMELPKLELEFGNKKIKFIDKFLNEDRTKYINIRPSCGIILSNFNFHGPDRLYFIINIFANSMTSSIYRANYRKNGSRFEFISYDFLEGT